MRRANMMTVQTQQVSAIQTHICQPGNWQRWVSVGLLGLTLISGIGWHFPVIAADASAPAASQETYVMISFSRGVEFFAWAFAGMYDAARMFGPHVNVEWQGPVTWNASLEANTLQNVIRRRVNGILVSAADKTLFTPVINTAIEAGIPVICFDSDAPESKRLAVVTTDNYQAGYTAGVTMAQWLNGKGAIGVSTIKNAMHLEERLRGFRAGVASQSPDTAIYLIEGEGQGEPQENALYEYKILLKAHPEIQGLFGTWAGTGGAAVEAVRDFQLQEQVSILAFDFSSVTINAIEQGEIRATVAQNPYLMGYYGMLLAYSAAHPTAVPSRQPGFGHVPLAIDTGVSIVGKETIGQFKQPPKVSVTQEPILQYNF
jgi:ribose transport system substrate-binding protein